MKTKFLYTALIGLLASSGISAMDNRLALIDGKQTGNQLTSFQGSSSVSSLHKEVVFTDFAQKNVNATLQLSDTDFLRVEGSIKYMGQDFGIMTDFLSYLNNYKIGMGANAPKKEIIISTEDTINIDHFSKYFCQNLLDMRFDNKTVTPDEFKTFKNGNDKAFDSFSYDNNCIFFALTSYLAKSEAKPVEIKNDRYQYNNLKFIFSPCPSTDKEKGTPVSSSFKGGDLPYGSSAKVTSPDTVTNYLSTAGVYSSIYDAMYNITLFKVEEDTYRINVKLSSKDSPTTSYSASNEYKARQVSNILLQLKK